MKATTIAAMLLAASQALAQAPPDTDRDGVPDVQDNCTTRANAGQADTDLDGYGNACDGDLNNDGYTNAQDATLFRQHLGEQGGIADFNADGFVNARDTTIFRQQLLGHAPGPSAQAPLPVSIGGTVYNYVQITGGAINWAAMYVNGRLRAATPGEPCGYYRNDTPTDNPDPEVGWYAMSGGGMGLCKRPPLIPPQARSTGIQPQQVGIVINVDDADSEPTARAYADWHGTPAQNIVRVSLGTQETVARPAFELARLTVNAKMGDDVQALALAFGKPSRVTSTNSITSAMARGYCDRGTQGNWSSCYINPYGAQQNDSRPWSLHGIRPAMMVAGGSLTSTIRLILRGAQAENTRPSTPMVVMNTPDSLRNRRAIGLPASQAINGLELRVETGSASSQADQMAYFQGSAVIPDLAAHRYPPGAWVDTLTSCAGMRDGCGGQTTAWQMIDAGATGAYGTVEEPTAATFKFPAPAVFASAYTGGGTLIEAAWRSIVAPYQGLLVGDPLAAPFGRP